VRPVVEELEPRVAPVVLEPLRWVVWANSTRGVRHLLRQDDFLTRDARQTALALAAGDTLALDVNDGRVSLRSFIGSQLAGRITRNLGIVGTEQDPVALLWIHWVNDRESLEHITDREVNRVGVAITQDAAGNFWGVMEFGWRTTRYSE